jgi:hypothetical protein
MSQENAAAKARHYLSEGRLTVRQVDRSGVVAVVCGHSGLVYRVESSPDLGGWLCNCPAHIDQCAHLTALRLGHGRQPEENRVTNERCPDCAEPITERRQLHQDGRCAWCRAEYANRRKRRGGWARPSAEGWGGGFRSRPPHQDRLPAGSRPPLAHLKRPSL